jgi:hypothetical protein
VETFDLRIGRYQFTLTVNTEVTLTIRRFKIKNIEKIPSKTVKIGTHYKKTGL